ncbi:MAG: dTDP-4-dehydrorhamnose reductase [Fimbriimonadaceae bacterium]|nr:dTDP-4-dehydrorhamnose reductase [Fimbriimonadaceae bacterium]
MRLLVIGGSGMLGGDFIAEALARGNEVLAPSRSELDITDPVSVAQLAAKSFGEFDAIVNCAAYTAVDKAETEVDQATDLNAIAPGLLAGALAMAGVPLMHLSTDFVFGEMAPVVGGLDEDHPPNPLGVYGRTKLDGEFSVLTGPNWVVRTSWLFGPNGSSFPRTIIRAYESGKPLKVVADQVGTPTYTAHLAGTLLYLLESNVEPGVYHAAGPDEMSWHELATWTLREWAGKEIKIDRIRTEDWPTPAVRPRYSALVSKRRVPHMPTIQQALVEFCERLRETATL